MTPHEEIPTAKEMPEDLRTAEYTPAERFYSAVYEIAATLGGRVVDKAGPILVGVGFKNQEDVEAYYEFLKRNTFLREKGVKIDFENDFRQIGVQDDLAVGEVRWMRGGGEFPWVVRFKPNWD